MIRGTAGEPHGQRASQHAELLPQLGKLSDSQLALIASICQALQVPVLTTIGPSSDIVGREFSETMSNLLTVHHALHEEPLSKKSFEYLFKQCLGAAGISARLNPNPGDAAWDVEGADIRWSLKTEAAKGISRRIIKIEKLMEARWVREATTPESCAEAVRTLLPRHMGDYQRIVVLRAFSTVDGFSYSLEEIPTALLLDKFSEVKASDIAKNGKAKSYGADFFDNDGQKIFRLLLDSSVEKVRLWFQADYSVNHGSWRIQVGDVQEAQQELIIS